MAQNVPFTLNPRILRGGALRIFVLAGLLFGCAAGEENGPIPLADLDLGARGLRGPRGVDAGVRADTLYFEDDGLTTARLSDLGVTAQGQGYAVNLQGMPVEAAAKAVLAETLGATYSIDPGLDGSITLVTGGPVSREVLLMVFEEALAANGLVLQAKSGGSFRILASGQRMTAAVAAAGYGITALPLQSVPAAKMVEMLNGFAVQDGALKASARDDMILVRGTSGERRAVADLVASLDVEALARDTAAIVFLARSEARLVGMELEEMRASGDISGQWQFQVLEHANAILVSAGDKVSLRKALTWIERLDSAGAGRQSQITVYHVQYGRASELADLLNQTFGGAVAPAAASVPIDILASEGASDGLVGAGQTMVSLAAGDGPRFAANDADNTIVIRANDTMRRDAVALLVQLDTPPTQVMIDVILVEVSLNDATRFGVQAYLDGRNVSLLGANGTTRTIAPVLPGFSLMYGNITSPKVIIDSLEQVTKVKVVSAPSVLAFENEPAEIKVVEQVPIVTQQVTSTQTLDAPVVNSIEYRDAGVILRVTPTVSDTGLVNLLVAQELSAVITSSTGTTALTPTLRQRSISTRVSVPDQQTVALGGLISSQSGRERRGLLGSTQSNSAARSELVVFITPHVVRSGGDAAAISEELKAKMTMMGNR